MMDDVLTSLRRAFRVLVELGVETIVFTADHGYLFGDELDSDMKIDPPGGNTVDLHRRVWVGHGGSAGESYLRARSADFGLSGDFEIAVPWNFACFKVPAGAKAYFHGGMSPQELVIPVVTLRPKQKPVGLEKDWSWVLTPGSPKISTRFFSVQVTGKIVGLYEAIVPKVRVEIRSKGEIISTPISASYGFEEATGDVQLRIAEDKLRQIEPNTITVMVIDETAQKTATVHLIDSSSGAELIRLDKIEIVIAI
jgi:hypothetical protein